MKAEEEARKLLSEFPAEELAKGLEALAHDLSTGVVILYGGEILLAATFTVQEAARRIRNG